MSYELNASDFKMIPPFRIYLLPVKLYFNMDVTIFKDYNTFAQINTSTGWQHIHMSATVGFLVLDIVVLDAI